MKGRTILVLVVIAAAIGWFLWRGEPESPRAPVADPGLVATPTVPPPAPTVAPPRPPPTTPAVAQSAPQIPPSTAPAASIPPSPPEPPPAASQPSVGGVEAEIDNVSFAIRDYRNVLKENPVGNNAEITKALLGDNLKQVKIAAPVGSTINGEGELCDRWGTPYFFHALSKTSMEIRSAGPDRRMWTDDDRQAK
jgi:hypothetical protein